MFRSWIVLVLIFCVTSTNADGGVIRLAQASICDSDEMFFLSVNPGLSADENRTYAEIYFREGVSSRKDYNDALYLIQRAADNGCFEKWAGDQKRYEAENAAGQKEYDRKIARKKALIEGDTSFQETHEILSKVLQGQRLHFDTAEKGTGFAGGGDQWHYTHMNYQITDYEGDGCNISITKRLQSQYLDLSETVSFNMSEIEKLEQDYNLLSVYKDVHPKLTTDLPSAQAGITFKFKGDAMIDGAPVLSFTLPVSSLGNDFEDVYKRVEIGLYHLKHMCPYKGTDAF